MKVMIPAVAAMIFAVSPAFASEEGHCDTDIKAVDAAMRKAKLSNADLATVKAALAKADALHKAGKEEDCEKALAGAHKLLGTKEEHQE